MPNFKKEGDFLLYADKIKKYILENKEDLIQLTSDLISINTCNPPGSGNKVFAKFVEDWAQAAQLDVKIDYDYHENAENNPAIFVSIKGNTIGNTKDSYYLCFQGHYDTITVVEGWKTDPHRPVLNGNCLYGLGATDMKGGVASKLFALKTLRDLKLPLKGPITILLTPNEEFHSGGPGLAEYLDVRGIPGKYIIVGEPSSLDEIHIGMKGAVWGDINIFGSSAHGSNPTLGNNAWEKAVDLMNDLRTNVYPRLKKLTSDYPITPKECNYSTLMLGGLVKGSNLGRSVVPDKLQLSFDIRKIPDKNAVDPLLELQNALKRLQSLDSSFKAKINIATRMNGYLLGESPFLHKVKNIVSKVTGLDPTLSVASGAMDTFQFVEKSSIALALGPGRWKYAHRPNELVEVSSLIQCTQVYALLCI